MNAADQQDFRLREDAVTGLLDRGRAEATEEAAHAVLARSADGGAPSIAELALLWFSPLPAEALYEHALARKTVLAEDLETFSPLYLTNTCDAECGMCGMRRDNEALVRKSASVVETDDQLQMLYRRGMHAVALLTGEYRRDKRQAALRRVNQSLRTTQKLGFDHVLINVGSIESEEADLLLDGVERNDDGSLVANITMCTFQETYSRERYARFMGTNTNNPRSDYDRRLANFDRMYRAGMRIANPGILVGLNPDIAFDMLALSLHTRHLEAKGMEVYLSVPRLRRIAGSRTQGGVGDEDFLRLVSLLSFGLPNAKVVLTTREPEAIQEKLVPIVTVLSAGSASVSPYTETSADFPLEASQFEVIDQRPFEEILEPWQQRRGSIQNFDPPQTS